MQNLSLHARLIASLKDTGSLMYHAVLILLCLLIKSYKLKYVVFHAGRSWHNWQSQPTNSLTAARNSLTTPLFPQKGITDMHTRKYFPKPITSPVSHHLYSSSYILLLVLPSSSKPNQTNKSRFKGQLHITEAM